MLRFIFRSHRRKRIERLKPDSQNIFLLRRTFDIRRRTDGSALNVNLLLGQRAVLIIRFGYRDLRGHHCNRDGRHARHRATHKLVRHFTVRQRNSSTARPANLLVNLRANQRLPADLSRARLVPFGWSITLVLHAVRSEKKEAARRCCRRGSSRCRTGLGRATLSTNPFKTIKPARKILST